MADLVKFFVGNQENLDNLQKIKGQLVIALDTSNSTSPKGTLYYDHNSTQRVKLSSETAEKAIGDETGLNIRSNYLTSVEGSRNNTLYTITAKSGSGVTKNTFNIPINLVGSSATSSKIFLLGATAQSNGANNSYTNNNFYIENNILNGTFKGNITGKATTAGTADVALSVGWNNISDKPTNSIVSQIYKDTNGLNYKTLNGSITNLGLFAPLDSNSKTIPIEYIPKSAIERLFKVTSLEYLMANADEFPDLNLGDTILDLSDNIMYYIIGSDLTSADSYQEYSAGIASAVEWSNILNKPATLVSSFLTSESTTAFTITPRAYTGSNLTAITVPFANTSRAGLVTTLAQSFAGNKTFMGDITIGSNTDATVRTLYIKRKNSSSSNYGTFSITLPTTANYADIGFQYNESGTNSGYNLYMNSSALYPKSNNAYDLGTSSYKFKTIYATTFNGNATTATRATSDGSGNNINTTYVKSVTGASGTGYTITVTKGNGSTSSFTIPLATTGGLGLVSTGTQSFAGAKTFASTVTVNGDVYIGNNGKGYYLKDKKSRNYAGLNDNGSNFWIGTSGSNGGSHYGGTYLSTGFNDDDEGNATFFVSIPHVDTSGTYSHTNYYGLHSGNWKSYISDWRSLSWTNGTTAGPVPVFTDRVGGGKTNGAAIPVATSAVSGVVSTGSQSFSGNKIFNQSVTFLGSADASLGSYTYPAVTIGPYSSAHLEMDANEIMAKGSANTAANLYLNNEGGVVDIGPGGMNVRGHIIPNATTRTLDIGSTNNYFRNIYASSFSGNAATATKLQTARTINGTSFNGSANITTNIWGATRTLTIGHTAKSVNGSSNVSWSLNEIIQNNSIYPQKIAISDYYNYAQLNTSTASLYGWSSTLDENGVIYTRTGNMTRDLSISIKYYCNGGETFEIKGQISSNIKGNSTSGGTDSDYRSTAVMLICSDGKNNNPDYIFSKRGVSSANAEWVDIHSYVTIPTNSKNFSVYIQTESFGNWSGTLKVRNIEVIKMPSVALALKTARTIRTNLGSTSTASFDGTANITPGITGTLAIAHGGTGATSAATARDNLGAAAESHSHSAATTSAAGFMSAADKTKLNSIATSANNYVHPTNAGNKHIPSGGASGQILKWSANGTARWDHETNTWFNNASISGSTLTLTKGNGSTVKVTIPTSDLTYTVIS